MKAFLKNEQVSVITVKIVLHYFWSSCYEAVTAKETVTYKHSET